MARPLRIEFAGALYHVMARGNARAEIFKDSEDREAFLNTVGKVCDRFDWRIWAYCLMGNHYHLLVETGRPSLATGMREINGQYTQRFNLKHRRVGHLLQGRYQAILVEKDPYLLELCRYIVLNPVKARLAKRAEDWPWSSHRAMIGKNVAPPWLAVPEIRRLFENDTRPYAEFVNDGMQAPDPMMNIRHQIFLGTDAFIERLARKVSHRPGQEIPRAQRVVKTLPAYAAQARNSDMAIRQAYRSGAYTLKQIGAHFGLHYATVSRIARREV